MLRNQFSAKRSLTGWCLSTRSDTRRISEPVGEKRPRGLASMPYTSGHWSRPEVLGNKHPEAAYLQSDSSILLQVLNDSNIMSVLLSRRLLGLVSVILSLWNKTVLKGVCNNGGDKNPGFVFHNRRKGDINEETILGDSGVHTSG